MRLVRREQWGGADRMTIRIEPMTGAAIEGAINALATLRIAVFAAYPYLYDGDPDYEAAYLRAFVTAPGAVLVAALDGNHIVGAATASPLAAQKDAFRAPFEARGIATGELFYFGESVLLPRYRGYGIGHAFFGRREDQAIGSGAKAACFAAVVRPDNHPARPADHRPLDPFWRGRGYAPVPSLVTHLGWKDRGEDTETDKAMQYWMRRF